MHFYCENERNPVTYTTSATVKWKINFGKGEKVFATLKAIQTKNNKVCANINLSLDVLTFYANWHLGYIFTSLVAEVPTLLLVSEKKIVCRVILQRCKTLYMAFKVIWLAQRLWNYCHVCLYNFSFKGLYLWMHITTGSQHI